MTNKGKVVVGMSGGIDSSVAAALLKEEGYNVVGATMEIFDESATPIAAEGSRHACYGPGEKEDVEDARKVADRLGIPFYTINLKEKYKKNILNFVVKEYMDGNTPNPCVKCNHEIKFTALMGELQKQGVDFDYFATGHYARIEYSDTDNQVVLKKAVDPGKDQSYFLFNLPRTQLQRIMFPLGGFHKDDVKKMADRLAPEIGQKPESQDFIAGGYHQLFKGPIEPGPIFNTRGEEIGTHKGIVYYTVGQRRGIGVSGDTPLYVIRKDKKRNALVVGEMKDLMGNRLIAGNLNWLTFDRLEETLQVRARIRCLQKEFDVSVSPLDGRRVEVVFAQPQMAVTPGQAVVFYDGDVVVGGGIIQQETYLER